jgi:hypothetical protein
VVANVPVRPTFVNVMTSDAAHGPLMGVTVTVDVAPTTPDGEEIATENVVAYAGVVKALPPVEVIVEPVALMVPVPGPVEVKVLVYEPLPLGDTMVGEKVPVRLGFVNVMVSESAQMPPIGVTVTVEVVPTRPEETEIVTENVEA